jgi:SAM-dependent methyltransferase
MTTPDSKIARRETGQARVNAERWAKDDLVEAYSLRSLRAAEQVILERYREPLGGRVLELGCGAGRLTGHVIELGGQVHGVDISPAMVAHCRETYPGARFSVGDLSDLSSFKGGPYDAVLAPFNVIDVLGEDARLDFLGDARGLLAPGGLLVFSSHNRAFASRPITRLRKLVRLWVGNPRRPTATIRNLPQRLANRRRLRRLESSDEGYAVVNDEAHDFSLLHYYITSDAQRSQLEKSGFECLECLDLDGRPVAAGESAAHCSELHYVARPRM